MMGNEKLPGRDATDAVGEADDARAGRRSGGPSNPPAHGDAARISGDSGGSGAALDGADRGRLGGAGMVARDLAADDTDNDG